MLCYYEKCINWSRLTVMWQKLEAIGLHGFRCFAKFVTSVIFFLLACSSLSLCFGIKTAGFSAI